MELRRDEFKEPTRDILGGAARLTVDIGEHGFVSLVDAMPRLVPVGRTGDYAIVQAARTSYGQGLKTPEEDANVLRYLMRHSHTTPFEFVEVKFHMAMPLFVARQFIRHRTASVNEQSARYTQISDEFLVPKPDDVRVQSTSNKQVSEGALGAVNSQQFCEHVDEISKLAYERYETALSQGVPREQARMLLPVNIFTQWYWKCDLHNVLNFLRLRKDAHAQKEIRDYAEAMDFLLRPLFPVTFDAWDSYVWNAMRLTSLEVGVIQRGLTEPSAEERACFPTAREYAEWELKRQRLFGR